MKRHLRTFTRTAGATVLVGAAALAGFLGWLLLEDAVSTSNARRGRTLA